MNVSEGEASYPVKGTKANVKSRANNMPEGVAIFYQWNSFNEERHPIYLCFSVYLNLTLYHTHKFLLRHFIGTYEYSLTIPTIIAYARIVGIVNELHDCLL
ncbi:MAG: hypothetical protein RSA87_03685 [Malacoplasma sp.]